MSCADTYYVYVLFRETLQPFYIGFGKGDRWKQHEIGHNSKEPNSYKNNIIRDMIKRGFDIPKNKIAEGLTKAEAVALEIKMIGEIGRWPDGPLVNATSGGDGVRDMTPELIARISRKVSAGLKGNQRRKGIPHSAETKARVSALLKGRPASQNTRMALLGNKRGAANKGKPLPEVTKDKMKTAARKRVAEGRHHVKPGNVMSPEHVARVAESNRAKAKDPAFRAKLSASAKGKVFSESHLASLRIAQQKRWQAKRESLGS